MNEYWKLASIVRKYIYLQLQNPPKVIDEKEPKKYTEAEVQFFKKYSLDCDSFFNSIISSSENNSLSHDSKFSSKVYSRTEFFSLCFYELTKRMKLEDIEIEVDRMKLEYANSENFDYIKTMIDKVAEETIKIKKYQAKRNATYKNIEETMEKIKAKVLKH